MAGHRRWQTRPFPCRMIGHPAFLAEAHREYDCVRPQKRVVDGLTIVTYSRPRVYLDRDAWEMLPDDGVLLMRVRPTGGTRFALALTAQELERTFGEVKQSRSWERARCYHFPTDPPAARAFFVGDGNGCVELASVSSSTASAAGRPRQPRTIAAADSTPAPSEFYEWASWWYARLGAHPESAEHLAGVSAWRNAWRPKRVRAVLLAESHVAQHDGDARVRVRTEPVGVDGLPSQYVRLVYCLGYGESALCEPSPAKNTGTWQYWNILGQVAYGQNPASKERFLSGRSPPMEGERPAGARTPSRRPARDGQRAAAALIAPRPFHPAGAYLTV